MFRGTLLAVAVSTALPAQAQASAGNCFRLDQAVPAGAFLTTAIVSETACRGERPDLPLAYDRDARAPMAIEALSVGTYLGPLSLQPGAIAVTGEKLQLVIRNGPVTIIRDVQPVKAARSGEKTFVRTDDGDVLVARFVASKEAQ